MKYIKIFEELETYEKEFDEFEEKFEESSDDWKIGDIVLALSGMRYIDRNGWIKKFYKYKIVGFNGDKIYISNFYDTIRYFYSYSKDDFMLYNDWLTLKDMKKYNL